MAELQRRSSIFLKAWFLSPVAVYLAAAALAMAVMPFLAVRWMQAPVPVDLLEPLLRTYGLNPGSEALFPFLGQLAYFYLPYLIGLMYLLCAVWVYLLRRQESMGQAFSVLLAAVGLAVAGLFDLFTTRALAWLWPLSIFLLGGALFSLGVLFSKDDPHHSQSPLIRYAGYIAGGIVWLVSLPWLVDLNQLQHSVNVWRAALVLATAAAVFAAARVFRWSESVGPVEREQARIMLSGAALSFIPLAVWLGLAWFIPTLKFTPYLFLLLILFPAAVIFTARRERLLQVNYVVSRSMLYAVAALLVVIGYALLVTGLSLVFNGFSALNNPLLSGVVFFVLALVFAPLRQRLQDYLDAVFFRGERTFQERLQGFSGELTHLVEVTSILNTLRQYVEKSLQPGRLQFFLYDALTEQYCAAADRNGSAESDLRFSANSPVVRWMCEQKTAVFFSRLDRLPPALAEDEARVRLLDAQVLAPLPGQQRLTGWLVLGPRLSGEGYTARELNFVDSLCDQAALAVERAQVAAKMENRAREMTILARLAQGINVTLSFDDILELIFAQSEQIIPMVDFQLLLLESESLSLTPVFYVENNERLSARENKPLTEGISLEQETIRLRRPIIADDYARECQKRGFLPDRPDVYAWMCVPLNAGAETIGVVTAAHRDPAVTYAAEQVNLFQAVADQAAGAIIKMRLLHEAERRARQLTSLNEVTRQLTSTLELEPLLQTILNSAVDILSCDAGSLLLVDEQTGELVFRVAVGPVAKDLTGKRMPANAGLAGKAVKSQETVVVNNVSHSPDWSSKTDAQTGFLTRSVMVTPLLIKENVTGVVEVINRKDGLPFGKDDEALLAAFAAQAAIAIENARLYTLTDQALAARVEELSVMQRIDRELNASLDTSRAMRITLEWAMRQSGASAGLVGVVEETGLRMMASQGYTGELESFTDELLPYEVLNVRRVIETGLPERIVLNSDTRSGLLQTTRSQTLLAIQREEKVIGILLLESTSPELVPEETLAFLMRLNDHASIAISNAQLYAQVQAANLAKSEFVSFVSHELKNPMTSVKGFTELLAAGVVGPINEAQANFLHTIRTNINRMNTLVSDLNDLSKIEVGMLRLDFKALVLADAVEEVSRSTRRQIEEKEQTLQLQLPAGLPNAWSDRTRLVQILVNLVSNANKYTEKGGQIYLTAEACENQWDAQGARHVIHVAVRDSGIGISPADQEKIFQKFFRSDDPKTREATGTGLGLNITRSLVEMQGGRIWFESEFRKGTTFHFTIPVAE
jgi:signal transduction histidine kinase/putative methionine-R-sulfoxide reductase with GAF domain